MDFIRRQKPKNFTVAAKKICDQVKRQNTEKYRRLSCDVDHDFPSESKFSSQNPNPCTSEKGPKGETRKKLEKKIQVLDKMGFASLIETKADPVCIMSQALKRRFSIGISDFWTGKNRQKFLKEKGYDEAFKTLKKNVIIKDIQGSNSLRKPTLPYIMDNNMKRRSFKEISVKWVNSANAKKKVNGGISTLSSRGNEKMSEVLDSVVEKCNELVQDNSSLKRLTRIHLVDIKKDLEVLNSIKMKNLKNNSVSGPNLL